jgi:2-keto-4-pentenoate hydratase/2-oxohepta-3-ene-1,7-dioic acid hydratase in catechol pathway
LTDVTLLAPIPRPPKIVCIGVNDVELASRRAAACMIADATASTSSPADDG